MSAALAAWIVLPRIVQDPAYHGFSDQRAWLGIPHAADVLTSVPFTVVGLLGILRLVAGVRGLSPATLASLWCVAVGLLFTGAGSAWYHLAPSDATLAWDRLPMTLVFAGVVGAMFAGRVGERVARAALPVLVLLGIVSVTYWRATGDLSLYAALQGGSALAVVSLAVLVRNARDPVPWGWVIACYAIAKLAEVADAAIWTATGGLVAGHALKHVAAACAGIAALSPVWSRARTEMSSTSRGSCGRSAPAHSGREATSDS